MNRSTARGPILFCAATRDELETVGFDDATPLGDGPLWIRSRTRDVLAVTGVGIPSTLLRLPPLLTRFRPALVVTTGIAGVYPGAAAGPGDLLLGESECFADLGMELPDDEGFLPLAASGFADDALRAPLPLLVPGALSALPALARARGATVNACAGTDATGARRRRLFGADFETMEGAAVALAAADAGVPVVEIRAVSNIAARRDMRPENVRRALGALTAFWSAHRGRLAPGEPA